MKYGYNDYKWNENCDSWNAFCSAVSEFNNKGFLGFMKRKTYDEKDEKMLNALKEMVEMMEEHKKEMKKK